MRLFSNRERPVHLGPWPLERLPRLSGPAPQTGSGVHPTLTEPERGKLSSSIAPYLQLFAQLRDGDVAAQAAPLPADPRAIAHNLKASAYFLDADQVGIGLTGPELWVSSALPAHTHMIVILIPTPPEPEPRAPGRDVLSGGKHWIAAMRSAELAVIIAGYVRQLGFAARAHFPGETDIDLAAAAINSGLALERDRGLFAPFVGTGFQISAVTTSLECQPDQRLAPAAGRAWQGLAAFLGTGGTRPGWQRFDGRHRPLHKGRYPMEALKRRDTPTTYISDHVPRMPKRANFFTRALHGDLGPRAQAERGRFAIKTPSSFSYTPLIRAMVPLQTGETADRINPDTQDPERNSLDMKALATALGGDMTGICAVPDYAWYSHQEDGSEIVPYHRNAIVILVDQGFETMEGASGDDWISGAQSMRAYMRGAEIAGVMADHIRRQGYPARSHTNFDSDVLHIPLVLQAGLGELSRIGELVLNPFVGPRFKSVVVTADMPLQPDKPIDFGLQDFCGQCNKCARECPCSAIPFGDKTMFNGYEIWKPDAQKCVQYRVTNQKGSACGRCMKTCPFNAEGLMSERLFLWLARHVPAARGWIARLDDRLRRGSINPVKKWWFDLELIDGIAVTPKSGTNARELNFDRKVDAGSQKIAHFPFETAPPPDSTGTHKVDRAEGLARSAAAKAPPQGGKPMIKSVITFKRKPGLSVADFQDYWLNRHPTVVRQLNGLQRYVQSHPLPGGYASRELAVDGVAETWWPDTATMRENAASPVWKRLVADEEHFIDRSTMQMLLVEEHVLKDEDPGAAPYKVIELMHRRRDMSVGAYLTHWRNIHGPLGAAIPNVSRYVQNHPRLSAYSEGRQPAFDGFAMVWFADKDVMRDSPHSIEYKAAYADEGNFIDHARLDHVITREHEIPVQV